MFSSWITNFIFHTFLSDSELLKEHPKYFGKSIKKKGRRNIRDILEDSELTVDSKLASQEEEKRVKRLNERHEKVIKE